MIHRIQISYFLYHIYIYIIYKNDIFTLCFGPRSQSIGRGRISREGALDHRESRERRDKIFDEKEKQNKRQNFGSETAQFSVGNFHFFGRGKTNFFSEGYDFKTG